MAIFSEKMLVKLIDGATDPDGDPVSLRRINGHVPSTRPHLVSLPSGSALIFQDGSVSYDDGGDSSSHPSAGGSLSNGSFTFSIWDGQEESPNYTATVQLNGTTTTNTGSGPAQVKAALSSLYGTVGRNSGNTLVPIQGNEPAGVSISGSIISVTAPNLTFENYDFSQFMVWVKNGADGVIFRNCKFGRSGGPIFLGTNYHLSIEKGVSNLLVEQCNFDDYQITETAGMPPEYVTDMNRWSTSTAILQAGQSTGTGIVIRRNMIRWCPRDGIKSSGGMLLEENVIGAFSNVPRLPWLWRANRAYVVGDVVGDRVKNGVVDPVSGEMISNRGWVFICVQDNIGQALPGSVTGETAYWKGIDPHCDHFSPYENQNPTIMRRNMVYRDSQHADIPVADRASYVKATNAFRLVRNTGSSEPYVDMQLIENGVAGPPLHSPSRAIHSESSGRANWTAPTLTGNLLSSLSGGYFRVNSVYVDGGNYDWHTLAPISG